MRAPPRIMAAGSPGTRAGRRESRGDRRGSGGVIPRLGEGGGEGTRPARDQPGREGETIPSEMVKSRPDFRRCPTRFRELTTPGGPTTSGTRPRPLGRGWPHDSRWGRIPSASGAAGQGGPGGSRRSPHRGPFAAWPCEDGTRASPMRRRELRGPRLLVGAQRRPRPALVGVVRVAAGVVDPMQHLLEVERRVPVRGPEWKSGQASSRSRNGFMPGNGDGIVVLRMRRPVGAWARLSFG
jgi:hypothetical protein